MNHRWHVALFFSEMIYFDTPFGITDESWDVALDEQDLQKIFHQLAAVNQANHCVCVFKCKYSDLGMIKNVMEKNNFSDAHPIYWWKPDANVVGLKRYTFAVENLMVGYLGGRRNNYFNESGLRTNPENRHNIIQTPRVRSLHKNSTDDLPLNTCESPPALAHTLAKIHCIPGDDVIIIGAGSGSDVIGVSQAGCNVVAVEKDLRQLRGCQQRLNAHSIKPETVHPSLPPAFVHRMGKKALHHQVDGKDKVKELRLRFEGEEWEEGCICSFKKDVGAEESAGPSTSPQQAVTQEKIPESENAPAKKSANKSITSAASPPSGSQPSAK